MDSGHHLLDAAQWLSALLTGSATTVVATLAIAVVGLTMLSGRIDVRRASAVIIGVFVLAGAAQIAEGIQASSLGRDPTHPSSAVILPPPAIQLHTPPYDPYAAAAVPDRR